jgi:predicted pyridoxine 5'-phosphate oxidase superfamily flavin-nucleotide-binding protein
MADVLSEKARALIARPVLASLATLNPDGSPQITPLWIDLDGDDVVFNTAQGRKKARNL